MASANPRLLSRRRLVKSGLALAGAGFAGPFVCPTRAAEAVSIGLDNPLTGPLASLGKNELLGCKMAIDEINAKGGVLGRPVELIVEDFNQRGRRDGGPEGAQTDRPRQDRFSSGKHELGAFAGDSRGFQRGENAPHCPRRPH